MLATTSMARASAVGLEVLEKLELLEELENLEPLEELEILEKLEQQATFSRRWAWKEGKCASFVQKNGLLLAVLQKKRIFAVINDVRGSNEAPHFCL